MVEKYSIEKTRAYKLAMEYAKSLSFDSRELFGLIAKVRAKIERASDKKVEKLKLVL